MENPTITAKLAEGIEGKLPEPVVASLHPPEWLRDMPPRMKDEKTGEMVPSVKRCLPTVDAIAGGFLVPLPYDLEVSDAGWRWVTGPETSLRAWEAQSPVAGLPGAVSDVSPFRTQDAIFYIDWGNVWRFEMPEGWGIIFPNPIHRATLPFQTITILVDQATAARGPVSLAARWLDPAFRGTIEAGTPIAQAFPVPMQNANLIRREMTEEEIQHMRSACMMNPVERYREGRRETRAQLVKGG